MEVVRLRLRCRRRKASSARSRTVSRLRTLARRSTPSASLSPSQHASSSLLGSIAAEKTGPAMLPSRGDGGDEGDDVRCELACSAYRQAASSSFVGGEKCPGVGNEAAAASAADSHSSSSRLHTHAFAPSRREKESGRFGKHDGTGNTCTALFLTPNSAAAGVSLAPTCSCCCCWCCCKASKAAKMASRCAPVEQRSCCRCCGCPSCRDDFLWWYSRLLHLEYPSLVVAVEDKMGGDDTVVESESDDDSGLDARRAKEREKGREVGRDTSGDAPCITCIRVCVRVSPHLFVVV